MKLVLIDEANWQRQDKPKENRNFFVIGAVIIDQDHFENLHLAVEEIRKKYGFSPDASLKFSPNDRPENISRSDYLEAKKEVLGACEKEKVKFIGYCVLHNIIKNHHDEGHIYWGYEQVLTKVQQFVDETSESELFLGLIDRRGENRFGRFLSSCFTGRNSHDNSGFHLRSLVGFASVWDNTSHFCSVCDIATGSFNYIVNEPERDRAGRELTKLLRPLFWGKRVPHKTKFTVTGRGLLMRPETVTYAPYEAKYSETRKRILDWANEK